VICSSSSGIGRFGASDVKGKPVVRSVCRPPFAKSREGWGTHSVEVSTEGRATRLWPSGSCTTISVGCIRHCGLLLQWKRGLPTTFGRYGSCCPDDLEPLLFISGNNRCAAIALEFLTRYTTNERIVATLENRMKHLLFLGCYSIVVYSAHAQVNTGTIVVFQLTNEKFVIAADSRGVVADKPPEDTHCKIAAFKSHHVVFAVSGAAYASPLGIADQMPSWNAIDEAGKVVLAEESMEPANVVDAILNISSAWETRMLFLWTEMMLYHPENVREVAARGKGHLTTGIFAVARNGSIAYRLAMIVFDNGKPVALHPDRDCQNWPCADGMADVAGRYIESDTEFMTAYPTTIKSWGYELLRVVRLVDLTIAYDPSGTVHGPIDALELLNDGTISWRRKKGNCPENQDQGATFPN
jgi:hypothetical protein